MFNSDTNGRAATDFTSTVAFRWSMLFTGLAVAFLGMDIMVRRPMMRELAQVHSQMAAVEQGMEELVGVRNQVWETNNLLTSLKSQYRQLEDARQTVTVMQQLRKEIDDESRHTTAAFASLDRLVGIQNAIVSNTDSIQTAEEHVDRMAMLQDQVALAGERTEEAITSLRSLLELRDTATMDPATIQRAQVSVEQLAELKARVLTNSEGIDFAQTEVSRMFETVRTFGDLRTEIIAGGQDIEDAQNSLFEIVSLKNEIFNESSNVDFARDAADRLIALKAELNRTSGDIAAAQASAEQLVTLKDVITEQGGDTETAFRNTGRLFGLRDTLNSEMDLDGANQSLDSLVQIQSDLNGQGRNVVEALETLDVLTNLSSELRDQVDSISGMRKSLLDIILMESTVNRAVQVVRPLTELSNLRRMSDLEVRDAARTIIENRTARRPGQRRTASGSLKLDDVGLFGAEPDNDVLVPEPRDLDILPDGIE
ncbi:MAG: hypothetical protein VB858_05810 [Planctomycetaceae bacterium]